MTFSPARKARLQDAFARASAAHVVVDIQDRYCAPERAFYWAPARKAAMERLVDRIAGFTAATRSGLPPVWVVHLVGDAHQYMRGLTDWRGIVEAFAVDKGRNNIYQRGVIAEIYNQPVAANDHVLPKPQWSAFVNTTLHSHLQARGVDTLLLSGVFMDQCITSTARDAVQAGYDVYVMKDLSQACEGTVDEWGDILADEGIAPVTAQAVARLLPSQGRPVMPQPLRRCAP